MYEPFILSAEREEEAKLLDQHTRQRLHALDQASARDRAVQNRRGYAYLAQAIQQMHMGALRESPAAEFFREVARLLGKSFDAQRIIFPWELFRRDMTAASAAQGGYLIGSTLGAAKDILRPWSVVVAGGVAIEERLRGDLVIPVTVSGTTVTWSPTESSQATASTPGLSQVAMEPKVGISIVNASRQFMTQADPERWLRRELLRAAGVAIDTAVLNGSGASGQPLGLLNTQGLSTQSGTSLAWSGVLAMKKNAALANVPDGTTSFISTPTIRALLEAREKVTGNGGFIWQDDRIANSPAFVTTLMPSGTMVSGPLSGVTLGLWGGGLEIEINPFDPSMFKTAGVAIRVLVAVDVAVTVDRPAFTVATSIT